MFNQHNLARRYHDAPGVKKGILSAPYRYGDTYTSEALRITRQYLFNDYWGDRPDVQNFAIVITDGISNIRNWRTIPEAHETRDAGIHMFSIGRSCGGALVIS